MELFSEREVRHGVCSMRRYGRLELRAGAPHRTPSILGEVSGTPGGVELGELGVEVSDGGAGRSPVALS